MSKWSECAHTSGVWRVCARSCLTEGVSEAWCWRNFVVFSCWKTRTVIARVVSELSTLGWWWLLLSRPACCHALYFYERSMYPFHSSVTSQTHMPQLHPAHPASLPPNHVKNNRSRNSLLRHDTGEEKKRNLTMTKRSMYPFHSSVTRRQRLTEGVSEAWCLKKFELNCLTVLLYTVMYIPFGTKWWLFNFGMAQILFMD